MVLSPTERYGIGISTARPAYNVQRNRTVAIGKQFSSELRSCCCCNARRALQVPDLFSIPCPTLLFAALGITATHLAVLTGHNQHRNSLRNARVGKWCSMWCGWCTCAKSRLIEGGLFRCPRSLSSSVSIGTRCNGGLYLQVDNRCHADCVDTGFITYNPGTNGRECRAPFTCADRLDENGAACKCSREVGRGNCAICDYGVNGVICTRCRNFAVLLNGACVRRCPYGTPFTCATGGIGCECE